MQEPGLQSWGWRLSTSLGKYAIVSRPRYMLSWPVLRKFKQMLGQRNMLVFALRVRWLWKPFRLPKHLHWCDSAKKQWMTFPRGIIEAVLGPWTFWGMRKWNCKLTRDSTVQKYVGPGLTLEVSRETIRKKIKSWTDNQHMAMWRGSYQHPETSSKTDFGH